MAEDLQADGRPVPVGNVVLVTPGLRGRAETYSPRPGEMRAAASSTAELEEALREEGVQTQQIIELTGTAEVPGISPDQTRSTAWDEPAIEVRVPDPGEDWGQVLLARDEAGVVTWNFARSAPQAAAVRGGATRTYRVRRHVPVVEEGAPEVRGPFGAIGKKILKVVAFKLIDKVAGEVADHFVGKWEAKKRSYRARGFTLDDYARDDVPELDGEAWTRLEGGRALLFVHGTFSRTHAGFGSLPRDFVAELRERYGGRVLAFDHPTVSQNPAENVRELVARIPDGTDLELDIVCHSRGGLVSRVLAEKQSEISLGSRQIGVRRIAFVATPNAGTVLADWQHIGRLIDLYSNLLNFFPGVGVIDVLQSVIAVVKQVAVGAEQGLDGLTSMVPSGDFLRSLNVTTDTKADYFALSSNYEPANPGLRDFAKDALLDSLHMGDNDLIVPTAGVYAGNGSTLFPIERQLSLDGTRGVGHSAYFTSEPSLAKLREWLTG